MEDLLESWTLEDHTPGWEFRVSVYADPDAGHPKNKGEVYDPDYADNAEDLAHTREILRAWHNDEWRFVMVQVVPVRVLTGGERVALDDAAQMLGSVEWGAFPAEGGGVKWQDQERINAYPVPDLIREALGQVSDQAERLRNALRGL